MLLFPAAQLHDPTPPHTRPRAARDLPSCFAAFLPPLLLVAARPTGRQLRKSIEGLLAQEGARRPDKARFFRGQMQTIISKALGELDIKPVPSRRCFTLMSWLQDRVDNVYKADPRYNEKSQSMFMLDLGPPEPLPDALRGEKWAFVQLPLGPLREMLKRVS